MTLQHLTGFYVPWSAAVAASSVEPPPIDGLVLHLQGIDLPVVQAVLAVAGVLLARPLARKKEAALPLSHFLVVTAIMLLAALAWVSEARPGVLFTFVVAIGLGFSGYALIENAGEQIQTFVKRSIASAIDAIGSVWGKPK